MFLVFFENLVFTDFFKRQIWHFYPQTSPWFIGISQLLGVSRPGVRTPPDTKADTQWRLKWSWWGYVEEKWPKKVGKWPKMVKMSKFRVKKNPGKGIFKKKISSFNWTWKNVLCRLLPPSVGQKLWLLRPFKEGEDFRVAFWGQRRHSHGHSKYCGSQATPY